MASESRLLKLKDFNLKEKSGKVSKVSGRPKFKVKGQQSLFEFGTKAKAKKFSLPKRVGAFKSAFRAKKILRASNLFSHAAVGLGVERAIELSGVEKSLGADYASELGGVVAFGATRTIGKNVYRKTGYGESLRKGFSRDFKDGFKFGKSALKKIGRLTFGRKLGL